MLRNDHDVIKRDVIKRISGSSPSLPAQTMVIQLYTHWSVGMACSAWSSVVSEEGCAGHLQLRLGSQRERASRWLEKKVKQS